MTASTRLPLFALRLLRRDLASGRLLVMLLAAVVAVASATSINLLVARVERVMLAESSALLAGDLALTSRDPIPAATIAQARAAGLETALTVTLRSVVGAGDALQLVRLKAVDDAYPLRGEPLVAAALGERPRRTPGGPPRGELWGDPRLVQLLGLDVGERLAVGRSELPLGAVLVLEPDRGGDVFALAPRVMMNLADLAATDLIVPGSRASYALLMAGPPAALEAFRADFEPAAGDRLIDPREARPEMETAFTQAERFLALAAFAGILLAAIGIALAGGAYSEHHAHTVAILKTLGLTRRRITAVLALEILLLAATAALVGDGLAWAVHNVLLGQFLPDAAALDARLPLLPLAYGAWVATVVLAGFALPTLTTLTRLPVITILNRDRTGMPAGGAGRVLGMIAAVALIAPWHTGNPRLVAFAFVGMTAAALAVAGVAWLLVQLLGGMRSRTAMSWRFGLANVARRARLSVVQTTAIGLGIAVLLLLGLVRDDLFGQWRARLPEQAPNQFLINIQPDEVAAVRDFLATHGHDGVAFYPMVRGRLVRISATEVDPDTYEDPRARRLADREFNLSWATTQKTDNVLLDGRWWPSSAQAEMSVESGLAERLGITLGDTLEFSVADRSVTGVVTSLRGVEWDNFEVNFFVVTTPDLLHDAPATWITSFYLPPSQTPLLAELVKRFPSVTVIDVDALMRQVRQVMERVADALGWVAGFALAAGILVLAAAVQASQRERVLDVILLKTLGAPRRFISASMLVEFVLLGAVAGALGACGALATGWLLADRVFDMPWLPDWRIAASGIVAGIVGVSTAGGAVVWRTHRQSVVAGLRAVG
ncbi:MAG: ABC transporter permease [Gammaproteobacteria bacterium]